MECPNYEDRPPGELWRLRNAQEASRYIRNHGDIHAPAIASKRDLRDTHHTRSCHSAECYTNHSLVASRIAISPKKIHSSRPQGFKKVDFGNVKKSEEILMSFEALVRSETASWDINAPVHEEWLKVKHHLAENVKEIRPFLDAKRKASL
ncbi:unnamed protein product [Arctia plantaginis]|uniref:Uncharacterized protein n=1 Tax=Arctia plantaginis TaxID=874455 RepID=A0A8S0YWG6_ARCPL|nr:unnamed protein product [Arctia plantaginis]